MSDQDLATFLSTVPSPELMAMLSDGDRVWRTAVKVELHTRIFRNLVTRGEKQAKNLNRQESCEHHTEQCPVCGRRWCCDGRCNCEDDLKRNKSRAARFTQDADAGSKPYVVSSSIAEELDGGHSSDSGPFKIHRYECVAVSRFQTSPRLLSEEEARAIFERHSVAKCAWCSLPFGPQPDALARRIKRRGRVKTGTGWPNGMRRAERSRRSRD